MKKSIGSFADAALSREQQRSVTGGCYAQNPGNSLKPYSGSMAGAKAYAKRNGSHWCCSSCGSVAWLSGSI
jgi:hypothetical protein